MPATLFHGVGTSPAGLDPCNGIALNALYDRAFDRGLITFDESFRPVLCHAYKLGLIGRKGPRCKEQRRKPGP